jgi:hypothetical protein
MQTAVRMPSPVLETHERETLQPVGRPVSLSAVHTAPTGERAQSPFELQLPERQSAFWTHGWPPLTRHTEPLAVQMVPIGQSAMLPQEHDVDVQTECRVPHSPVKAQFTLPSAFGK